MKSTSFITFIGAAILGIAICIVPVHAAQGRDSLKDLAKPSSPSSYAPANQMTLQRATAIARKEVGGRVLSANEGKSGGAPQFSIRMLVDGERVVTVVVDSSGRVNKR